LVFEAKAGRDVNTAQMPKTTAGFRSFVGLLNNIFAGVIKTKGIKKYRVSSLKCFILAAIALLSDPLCGS